MKVETNPKIRKSKREIWLIVSKLQMATSYEDFFEILKLFYFFARLAL